MWGRNMSVVTLEGIVENGQIRLITNVQLPENTKVYVVIPDIQVAQVGHIYTPRLKYPQQMKDFELEVLCS
jgi:hypothetical protein